MQFPIRVLLLAADQASVERLQKLIPPEQEADLQIVHAARLESALCCLAQASFNGILFAPTAESLDLNPVKILRQAQAFLPIVVLTNPHTLTLGQQAMRLGAHDHLEETGLTWPLLLRSLRYALERAQNERLIYQNTQLQAQLKHADRVPPLLPNELQYRQLFENHPQPMMVYDVETLQFLAVNEAAVTRYGHSRADFLTMTLDAIQLAEVAPGCGQIPPQLCCDCRPVGVWQHRLKDGRTIFVDVVSQSLQWSQHQALLILVYDITDRIPVANALRASEERFRGTFEQAAVGMCHVSLDGHFLRINQQFCEITGYTVAELQGLTFQEITHPDDLEADLEQLDRLLRQVIKTYSLEKRYIRKDGTPVWANLTVSSLHDWTGKPVENIAVVEDISERKRNEAERKQTEAALRASEHKHRTLVEALPDLIMRMSGDGIYLDFFPPETFSVLATAQVIGQHINDGSLPPDIVARRMSYIRQALSTGELQIYEQTLLVDGELRKEEVRITRLDVDEVMIIVRDITDRKRTERALQQSEATNRAIIESIPDLLIQMDREGRYNQMLGGKAVKVKYPDQIQGHFALHEVLPPNLAEQRLYYAHQALATGDLQVYEQTFDCDGDLRDEEVRITPLTGDEVLVIIRDVSDRKQAERNLQQLNQELEARVEQRTTALRASESRLRSIFEQSPIGIAITDLQGRITRANASLMTMLGYNATDILRHSIQDVLQTPPAADGGQVFDPLFNQTQALISFEQQIVTHHHQTRWVKVISVLLLDGLGQPAGTLHLIDDITAEIDAKAALFKISSLQQAILNSTDYAIISTDADGIIQTFNAGAERMLGYPATEVIGKVTPAIFHDPDELAAQAAALTVDLGRPVAPTFEVFAYLAQTGKVAEQEWTYCHKEGTQLPVALSLSVLWHGPNTLTGYVGIAKDITQRKQAEEALRQTNDRLTLANAELHRATRLKDEFLANMSHELRTPLNAILGMAEGLEEGVFGALSERQRSPVSTIYRSGKHLLDLINDILDLSKIEAGKLELQKAPVSIRDLCESSLAFVRQQAYQKQIQLSADISPGLPDIVADNRRLRQVLINLLSNAVKFTSEGGCVRLLAYREVADPSLLTLSVMDTGIGIAPEDLKQLFQPFVQVDTRLNRRYSGTGLGLALVRRLAELHSGTVSVTSQVGQGSCFTVKLPYAIGAPQPFHWVSDTPQPYLALTEGVPRQSPTVDTGLTTPNPVGLALPQAASVAPLILLTSHYDANVASVMSYLTRRGYRLIQADNEAQVVTIAACETLDLLLLDIPTVDSSGLQLLRQIRTNPQLEHLFIIAFAALTSPQDREICLAAGANEYFSKPIRLKCLSDAIQMLLVQR